jgi:hypothetical protein
MMVSKRMILEQKKVEDKIKGIILSAAVFQAERRACPEPNGEGISRGLAGVAREIPRPAGENAGPRNDASVKTLDVLFCAPARSFDCKNSLAFARLFLRSG